MGHKKYYGYKPKEKQPEHYEVMLYEKQGQVGESIDFVYEEGRCGMNHYYWGGETDYELNRRGRVEQNYIWDEENTKKLMLETDTKNGKDLVSAIYQQFHSYGSIADFHIKKWCEEKEIKCDFLVWY